MIGGDVWETLNLCDFAEKGSWPVGGGTLDQTACFLECMRLYRRTTNRLKPPEIPRLF